MQDKKEKTCIIYCRKSAVQQNNNSSIESQEEILKAIANKRRLEVKKVFESLGTTTKIKELVEWINENRTDYLLTMGIDRLYRRQTDFNQILELIQRKRLKGIITPNKDFDAQRDISSILILGLFCNFEREIISKRIRAGIQAKRNK